MDELVFCPDIVDRRAKNNPTSIYASFPHNSKSLEEGYRDLTYASLANAVNKVAWWLDEVHPKVGEFDPVVYFGPNDLRWQFLALATQKSKRKTLSLNPNNAPEADVKLFDDLQCTRVIVDGAHKSRFSSIIQQRPSTEVITMPNLEHWLEGQVEHYPFQRPTSEEEAWKTPGDISHTSGTTGNPKQAPIPLGFSLSLHRQRLCSETELVKGPLMYDCYRNKRVLMPFPMTWSAGLHIPLEVALHWNFIPVLLPADAPQPISTNMIIDALKFGNVQAAIMLPFHMKEIVKNPNLLQSFAEAKLQVIGYAGASLDNNVADTLDKYVTVQPLYGSTDVGMPAILGTDGVTGQYLGFPPNIGCIFEPVQGSEDLFQMIYRRDHDPYRLVTLFDRCPEIHVWPSGDLFKPHPTDRRFWLPVGRADDLVKNFNLTKFRAHDVETIIERAPDVQGAMMGGQGDKRPYLLVEVNGKTQSANQKEILELLWPTIKEANGILSEELQFDESRVIITSSTKPIPRLGKGTINRRAVPIQFQDEIEALGA